MFETETVDLDAATVEVGTVPLDTETVSTPPRIILSYPSDTSAKLSDKFPSTKITKRDGHHISMGRNQCADILLNDEHMPRQYVELWCAADSQNSQIGPKWFIKNKSNKKSIRLLTSNSEKKILKFDETFELNDSSVIKIETLTFHVTIVEGDLNSDCFELVIKEKEDDLMNSANSVFLRQLSSSSSGDSAGLNHSRNSSSFSGSLGASHQLNIPYIPSINFTQFPVVHGLPATFSSTTPQGSCIHCNPHSQFVPSHCQSSHHCCSGSLGITGPVVFPCNPHPSHGCPNISTPNMPGSLGSLPIRPLNSAIHLQHAQSLNTLPPAIPVTDNSKHIPDRSFDSSMYGIAEVTPHFNNSVFQYPPSEFSTGLDTIPDPMLPSERLHGPQSMPNSMALNLNQLRLNANAYNHSPPSLQQQQPTVCETGQQRPLQSHVTTNLMNGDVNSQVYSVVNLDRIPMQAMPSDYVQLSSSPVRIAQFNFGQTSQSNIGPVTQSNFGQATLNPIQATQSNLVQLTCSSTPANSILHVQDFQSSHPDSNFLRRGTDVTSNFQPAGNYHSVISHQSPAAQNHGLTQGQGQTAAVQSQGQMNGVQSQMESRTNVRLEPLSLQSVESYPASIPVNVASLIAENGNAINLRPPALTTINPPPTLLTNHHSPNHQDHLGQTDVPLLATLVNSSMSNSVSRLANLSISSSIDSLSEQGVQDLQSANGFNSRLDREPQEDDERQPHEHDDIN